MKRRLSKLILLISFAVACVSLFKLTDLYAEDVRNQQTIREANGLYSPTAEQTGVEAKFAALRKINQDVVGWLQIDSIKVSYPVAQAEDNDYYLNRNWKGEESRAGSIFIDYRNDLALEPEHIILYGHRMNDGSMFGQLKRYLDEDFFKENRSFDFETQAQDYRAEIFSVYVTTTDDYYIQTDFDRQQAYESFLRMIQGRSHFTTDTIVTEQDQILTLSTCDYTLDPEEGRLVVHAKIKKRV
ncbi:SrtB family sortase [Ammoniphilus oxalaticus]|uniref:SrtB family sortase n=1 Tax=Ammoniphilus oxalaticus TaxID=66863 RepID=A0A419SGM6_9BACL|nr:class B sortase [Ammoniphilus oxalaticus]RKD22929.1 SrtB family sortase [Ammoniphilus oxalaticus]